MNNNVDITKAVNIADGVWWVGHFLENDPFQCHVYLIENGNDSILIDPGSKLTFSHTLNKIEQVMPFENIKYLICQHQDPDITGALSLIEQIITRKDVSIISHWRAIALLKHYGLKIPFICVEEEEWQMNIGERILKFIFTPYLHFPGAFCTFDVKTGTLFSSDIFGAFTENWSLFAQDEKYFEAMRPFHEHYMPSREILFHAITKMEQYPVQIIAPQHGSIITGKLVKFMMDQLKTIECGLYLMTQTSTDVVKLSRLNKILRNFLETLIIRHDFSEIANSLSIQASEIFPIIRLSFYAKNQDGTILLYSPETMYRGVIDQMPDECRGIIGMTHVEWHTRFKSDTIIMDKKLSRLISSEFSSEASQGQLDDKQTEVAMILPLYTIDHPRIHGIAVFYLSSKKKIDPEENKMLLQLSVPLSVAVEREIILRTMELEKQKFYEQAIHDPLTGLYTRTYMNDAAQRLFNMQDREKSPPLYLLIIDIDKFKEINDSCGHNFGDEVLRQISKIIIEETRSTDIQVRLGGEEFAIFLPLKDEEKIFIISNRIQERIFNVNLADQMIDKKNSPKITVSGGIVKRRFNETIAGAIFRADMLLYQAKNTGRRKILHDLS